MFKKIASKLTIHSILIATSLLSVFPFIWLLSTSLKGIDENIFAYPPIFIPQDFTLDNFKEVLKLVPIVKYVINSFIVAGFTVILNVILFKVLFSVNTYML
mgnify:CR=1 FL=1